MSFSSSLENDLFLLIHSRSYPKKEDNNIGKAFGFFRKILSFLK